MRSALFKLVGIFALLVVVDLAVWGLAGIGDPTVADENNLVENAQAVLLGLGVLLFLVHGIHSEETRYRILFLGLGLVYLTALLWELETAGYQSLYPILALVNPPIRNYWLTAAWIGLALVILLNAKEVFAAFRSWVYGLPGVLMVLAGLLYGAGEGLEQGLWSLALVSPVVLEEILELNATVLMLFAAWMTGRSGHRSASRTGGGLPR